MEPTHESAHVALVGLAARFDRKVYDIKIEFV
jgi:hypothetical protein